MDETNPIFKMLLELLDRVGELKGKIDGIGSSFSGLCGRVDKLEERVLSLEKAPAKKWGTLTTSILVGIGSIIGGAIVYAVTANIKP